MRTGTLRFGVILIPRVKRRSNLILNLFFQDLQDLQIAYQPPNVSFSERQNFEVEFVVYDSYFAKSEPIRVSLNNVNNFCSMSAHCRVRTM